VNEPSTVVSPGMWGFVAFFVLAVALYFLMRNMNARMRRMSYRQQAAHRGKDEAQATPEDLAAEPDGPVAGSTRVDEADGSPPGPESPDDGASRGDGSAPGERG
jgi:hypothetical protein